MKITLLGTGTSQGIPIVACPCPVCQSADPRDNRLRCSVLIEQKNTRLLVDCGPDLRQQLLRYDVHSLDAVFLTHEHNDHIIGLDDLRPLIFRQNREMVIHSMPRVLQAVKDRFSYAFVDKPYPGVPRFTLEQEDIDSRFCVNDIEIQSFRVDHGGLPVAGIRVHDFAYVTDAKTIPDASIKHLQGLEVLVLGCLRQKEHYSHMNLEAALELINALKPGMTYLTHISHDFGTYREIVDLLPDGVLPAHDGLVIELNESD